MITSDDMKEEITEETNSDASEDTTPEPIEVIDKTPSKDKTSWETEDEWDIINMTEEDIKQAEESRHA